jgi:hypothetical protein
MALYPNYYYVNAFHYVKNVSWQLMENYLLTETRESIELFDSISKNTIDRDLMYYFKTIENELNDFNHSVLVNTHDEEIIRFVNNSLDCLYNTSSQGAIAFTKCKLINDRIYLIQVIRRKKVIDVVLPYDYIYTESHYKIL